MKGTPIFEEVFISLIRLPGIWLKILIGGLLSFLPIVNLFAFGFLFRYSRNIRRSGSIQLPEWTDWAGMFVDGLRFAVVWLVYWLLPLCIASVLSSFLASIGIGIFAYLIFSTVFLLSPVLFASALYRYQMREQFKDLLDINLILRMTYLEFPKFLMPAIAFCGLFAILMPIYGVAFFAGFLSIIAYTAICYRRLEYQDTVSF